MNSVLSFSFEIYKRLILKKKKGKIKGTNEKSIQLININIRWREMSIDT